MLQMNMKVSYSSTLSYCHYILFSLQNDNYFYYKVCLGGIGLALSSLNFCAVKSTQSRLGNFGNVCYSWVSKRIIARSRKLSNGKRTKHSLRDDQYTQLWKKNQEGSGRLQNCLCSQFWPEKVRKLQRVDNDIKLLALLITPHGDISNDRKFSNMQYYYFSEKIICP